MKNKTNTVYIIGKMAASTGFIAVALIGHCTASWSILRPLPG